jgi:hypothetical protein
MRDGRMAEASLFSGRLAKALPQLVKAIPQTAYRYVDEYFL